MQRFLLSRTTATSSRARAWSSGKFRGLSQMAEAVSPEEGIAAPKMPPFDYSPPVYDGPRAEEILKKRLEFLSPSLFHFYSKPLNIVDGKMQYLFDEDGRRYLDGFGGIATVSCGHCHPDVIEAIITQTKRLQHSTVLYLNHAISDFAEKLSSKLPGDLKVVFFTNSGTEANELALLISRLYTGCHDVVSLRNSYHGNASGTMGATAQSNWKFNIPQSGVHHALNPDQYRGVFGSDGEKYATDVQEIIDFGTSGHVAAFISEGIQGVGGIQELAPGYLPAVYKIIKQAGGLCIADEVQCGFARTGSHFWGFQAHGVIPDVVTMAKGVGGIQELAPGYLPAVYKIIKQAGGLCIADEVQCGFARTGSHFWGFQAHGVIPDVVTMAKGIGNGIPIGAVVTTPEIAQVLVRRNYFNTFGGNPVCAAGGLAVLQAIDKYKLQENAFVVGSFLKDRLKQLQQKHDIIGDVRGMGLMLGVELVTDRNAKTPAKAETAQVMDQMKEMGVLVGKGGFHGNVFRITPPLCITKDDAEFLVHAMDRALSNL